MSNVVKTNYYNQDCGLSEKLSAHRSRELHKAFSVFLHDGNGNMLIQKRAKGKYHSGGLWTNACCSHPLSEDVRAEAMQRMTEELGFSCDIEFIDEFVYYTEFDNGISEFELDCVFIGECENRPIESFDESEVEQIRWISIEDLLSDVCANPADYSRWFITALYIVVRHLNQKKK